MKKITSSLLALALVLGLALSGPAASYGQPSGEIKRLYGNDRFESSVAISGEGWSTSDNVIICTGEGRDKFADALAGHLWRICIRLLCY